MNNWRITLAVENQEPGGQLEYDFGDGQETNSSPGMPGQKLALITHPDYYNFTGNTGTWAMNQYQNALKELQEKHGIQDLDIVQPELATREDAALVHTPRYVWDVFGPTNRSKHHAWSGGPWDKTAQAAVLRSTGGMLRANQEAMQRGVAVQMYDAFHHAYPGHGEGFCVLNDIAIAAKKLSHQGKRVMVVDTDVHQGQGTAVCTKGDTNIYTLSTHERENYPGYKEHSSQDVELEYHVTDQEYLGLLENALVKAVQEFGKPDLVMYVAGTDLYGGDKLSHTRVTIAGIRQRDAMVLRFFGSQGVPVSVSVPQGYAENPRDSVTMIKNTVMESRKALQTYYGKS